MSKRFFTDIDLRFNEILKSALENIDTTSALAESLPSGRIIYATDWNTPAFWDGTAFRKVLWDGAAIDPRTLVQVGFDATEAVLLVSQEQIATWNGVVVDSTGFEQYINKNAIYGYAGLDENAVLDFSTLWDGMVVQVGDSTEYQTLGQLLDAPYGLLTARPDALLDPTKIAQDNTGLLFVTADEKFAWNNIAVDSTDFEHIVNKGIPNGYTPLNSSTQVPEEFMPDGVVYRNIEHLQFNFVEGLNIGDYYIVVYDGTSDIISVTDSTTTVVDIIPQIVSNIEGRPNYINLTLTDTTSTIDAVAGTYGYFIPLDIQYVPSGAGTGSIEKSVITPAFYDTSNIGGIPSIGFAPLNSLGIVEDKYLPNYRDMVIVADLTARDELYPDLVSETYGNGQMVFVIDATADPTVDDGWAQYLWNQSAAEWIKMTERESSVDVSHNVLKDIQGDLVYAPIPEAYHLTAAQLQKLREQEEYVEWIGIDAEKTIPDRTELFSYDATAYRSCNVLISYEDPTYKIITYTELKITFDGNRAVFNEAARMDSGRFDYWPEFHAEWDDINNSIKVYVRHGGPAVDMSARYKFFGIFNNILVDLLPDDSLLPANSLYPELVNSGPLYPSATLTPTTTLVPQNDLPF